MNYQHWQHCAICHEPTQAALCGNRLLSRWEVWRLPREQVPALSWRCKQHARYKMRRATAVRAGEMGDLIFSLACRHDVHWVFREEEASTPAMIEQGLTTHQIYLNPAPALLCVRRPGKRGQSMSEQERIQLEHAAQRYASSQGARALVILSVMEMVVPQAFGAHYAIALKARWGSLGVQPQLRAFVATQDQSKQWWFLSLPDEWLASLAGEIATTRGEREAKP